MMTYNDDLQVRTGLARKGCGVIQTRDLISNIRKKGNGAILMVCTQIRSVYMAAWWGKT